MRCELTALKDRNVQNGTKPEVFFFFLLKFLRCWAEDVEQSHELPGGPAQVLVWGGQQLLDNKR